MFSLRRTASPSRVGLTQRLVAASVLLALLVGGGFAAMLLAIGDLRANQRQARDSQHVTVAANQLERLLLDLETGQRGFVMTGQERFLEPWNAARAAFAGRARTLLALVRGDPAAARATAIVRAERAYIDDYSVPLVRAARRGDPSASSDAAADAGKRRVDALRAQFDLLLGPQERTDATATDRADSAARRASAGAAIGLGGSLVLIVLYVSYLRRAIVLPVRRAATMAGRLAGGDLGARLPETEAGEVGDLERAFNAMGRSLERNRDDLAALAEEQAALRRVATLVARGAAADAVFAAVADEVGRLLRADVTIVNRYEPGAAFTPVGGWSRRGGPLPVGERRPFFEPSVTSRIFDTGRPARVDSYGEAADGWTPTGLRRAVGAPISVEGRLWGVIVAAFTTGHELPPGTESRLAEFTEIVATAIANAESQAALAASRARIVTTADETRRRIERDLHDGAQQRLVSLALEVRATQATAPPDLADLDAELDHIAAGLTEVLDEVREIASGIHPAILAEGGLRPALRTLARRSALPVRLEVRVPGRLPEPVEVAAFYVVSEAIANAAKHAEASTVTVDVAVADGALEVVVGDDGVGGAEFGRGSGLVGLRDRVEALGGRMAVDSPRGAGTSVRAELPIADATT